jgi:hypothetical protein
VVVTKFATISFLLSNGQFVNVTVNDRNALATVTTSQTATAGAAVSPTAAHAGALQSFVIPAAFFTALGKATLTDAQRSSIEAAIGATVANLTVVTVPSNAITVSPSS